MINKEELVFAVDENNNPIEPVRRKDAHQQGIWHRTTDIAVVNSKGEALCHKRSMLKDSGPGLWDVCFGGHIGAETDSLQGAWQELTEESGLKVKKEDLVFVASFPHVNQEGRNKEFRYFYIYYWNGPLSDLQLEKDEIDEVQWIPVEQILKTRYDKTRWVDAPYLDRLEEKINSQT